jgi:ribosomal protein L29
MKRIKSAELSKLSHEELITRLNNLRSELSTLRSKAARGTLKKELGEIKTVRRNIARINTVLSSNRIASGFRKNPSQSSSQSRAEEAKS